MTIYEQTSRGIEYNTDVNDDADVLRDMENLAKTADKAIDNAVEEATYDDTSVKLRLTTAEGKIEDLEEEQTTQNANIGANANAISGLQGTVTAQGQTIETLDNGKVDKVPDKGLSTEDYTTEEKEKLEGIESGANKTIVDNELNDESTNPVQNKVITEHIEKLQTENARLKSTLPETEGEGENITLEKTAELEFKTPPLPRGNTKQESYSGKNLLKNIVYENDKTVTIEGITFTKNSDGSITANGTATANSRYYFVGTGSSARASISAGTYILNGNASGGSSSSYKIDWGITGVGEKHNYDGETIVTIESDTTYYLNIYVANGQTLNNVTFYPMIRLSSITDSTYEKYVGGYASPNIDYPQKLYNLTGDVEVKIQNENLFDGQWTGSVSSNFIKVFAGKSYRYSEQNNPSAMNWRFYEKTTDTSYKQQNTSANIAYVPEKDGYVKLYKTTSTKIQCKVEIGNTTNPYTPHQNQTFTFPLGTERMYLRDYLADDGKHHVRKQIVFDGSNDESFNLQSINSNGIANFGIGLSDYSGIAANLSLCDYFSPQQTPIAQTTEEGYYLTASKTLYFRIKSTVASTVAEFKTWLSTHNVTVEYELAEEEITPYTPAQQEVYTAIKEAISYEGQTNISGSSEEANPIFEVEAYQSTKLVLDEISNAIIALGGV